MNISKGYRFKIDMGGYESIEITVQPTMSHYDLGYTDEEWAGLTDKKRDEEIDRLLEAHHAMAARLALPDLKEAARLTDKRESVVHELINDSIFHIEPAAQGARRASRRASE